MKRQMVFAGRQRDLQPIVRHEHRQRARLVLAGCIALLTFTLACQRQAPNTRAAIESTLKELDAQWSKAAAAKDLDKTVSYYADDAIVLPPNAPAATTKEAIKGVWKDMVTNAGYAGGWTATRVEVAQSGDLAYLSGTYDMTLNDAKGKPVKDRGKYVEVWKKQADGSWKTVADIWNSDPPSPRPKKK
jgi:ketosteroid isomerase-like protein